MSGVYIQDPSGDSVSPKSGCLKIYNKIGEELSLYFDNSQGSLPHLSRVDWAIFSEEGNLVTPTLRETMNPGPNTLDQLIHLLMEFKLREGVK